MLSSARSPSRESCDATDESYDGRTPPALRLAALDGCAAWRTGDLRGAQFT